LPKAHIYLTDLLEQIGKEGSGKGVAVIFMMRHRMMQMFSQGQPDPTQQSIRQKLDCKAHK
jgi:hypothetical protein